MATSESHLNTYTRTFLSSPVQDYAHYNFELFDDSQISLEVFTSVLQLIQDFCYSITLPMHKFDCLANIASALAVHLPLLKALQINGDNCKLSTLVELPPGLQSLTIFHLEISNTTLYNCLYLSYSQLTTFALYDVRGFSAELMMQPNFPMLKVLILNKCPHLNINYLLAYLNRSYHLRILKLSDSKNVDRSFLLRFLEKNRTMQELSVDYYGPSLMKFGIMNKLNGIKIVTIMNEKLVEFKT